MENTKRLIAIFVITLIFAFICVRGMAFLLQDKDGYGIGKINEEKIRTPTAFLRQMTGLDVHHIHFGILFLLILIPLFYLRFINAGTIIFLAIGISMFLDQLIPWMNLGNYFGLPMIIISKLFHIVIIEICLILIIKL